MKFKIFLPGGVGFCRVIFIVLAVDKGSALVASQEVCRAVEKLVKVYGFAACTGRSLLSFVKAPSFFPLLKSGVMESVA